MERAFLVIKTTLVIFYYAINCVYSCPQTCHCINHFVSCKNNGKNENSILTSSFINKLPSNITHLYLSKMMLKEIQPILLRNLTILQVLYLDENKLSEIPKNISIHLPQLKVLSMRKNNIKSLMNIQDAHNLWKIDLTENYIAGLDDDKGKPGLKNLRYLEEINLSNNNILKISTNSFQDLKNLKTLNVSFNQLKSLPSKLFTRNKQLNSIDFSYNLINTIKKDIFDGVYKLRHISFESNKFNILPVQIFTQLDETKKVNFLKNPIICNCFLYKNLIKISLVSSKILATCHLPKKFFHRNIDMFALKDINSNYKCDKITVTENETGEKQLALWIGLTLGLLFVTVISFVSFWYYKKRQGQKLCYCSSTNCCCCLFIFVLFISGFVFFTLRVLMYMYENA